MDYLGAGEVVKRERQKVWRLERVLGPRVEMTPVAASGVAKCGGAGEEERE